MPVGDGILYLGLKGRSAMYFFLADAIRGFVHEECAVKSEQEKKTDTERDRDRQRE